MIAIKLTDAHEEGMSALALLAHGKITRAALEEMLVARRRGRSALEAAIHDRMRNAATERPRVSDRHRRSSARPDMPALRLAGSW